MPTISGRKLKEAIYGLYKSSLIYIKVETAQIDREDILAKETNNRYSIGNFYFGLTQEGVKFWENASEEYGEPLDWSNNWAAHYSPFRQDGYIDGSSQETCLKELMDFNRGTDGTSKEWKVDMNSLIHSDIEGFQASYYKYIPGGHRISFKLKRVK
ncbi:hypothetical protein ACFLYS_01230 [Chloroflexota bacterium]